MSLESEVRENIESQGDNYELTMDFARESLHDINKILERIANAQAFSSLSRHTIIGGITSSLLRKYLSSTKECNYLNETIKGFNKNLEDLDCKLIAL